MDTSKRHRELGNALLIALFYAIAFAPLLLDAGVFWDDWTLFRVPAASVTLMFHDVGQPLLGALHVALQSLGTPLVYRALTFVAHLASALALYAALAGFRPFTASDRLGIALLFAVFPLNMARIAAIDLPYSLCSASFFVAVALTFGARPSIPWASRLLALPLFALAFLTPSFILLYGAFLLALLYAEIVVGRTSWSRLPHRSWRYADFVLLPLVFLALRARFLHPHGLYAAQGYNRITRAALQAAPSELPRVLGHSFAEPLRFGLGRVLGGGAYLVPVALAVLALGLLLIPRGEPGEPCAAAGRPAGPYRLALACGAGLFVASAFPYLAVGKPPLLYDWDSRHQLLLPLPCALIVWSLVRLTVRRDVCRRAVLAAVAACCVAVDVAAYLDYQTDWLKARAIAENLRTVPGLREHGTILVRDEARSLNAMKRSYRFYEWNGLARVALGPGGRLLVDEGEWKGRAYYEQLAPYYPHFNMEGYRYAAPDRVLVIHEGDARVGLLDRIRWTFTAEPFPQRSPDALRRLVRLELMPLPGRPPETR